MAWPKKNNCKDNFGDLWHVRHWLQFWHLRTWIRDNNCYLTINSDSGQHSQFSQCFIVGLPLLCHHLSWIFKIQFSQVVLPHNWQCLLHPLENLGFHSQCRRQARFFDRRSPFQKLKIRVCKFPWKQFSGGCGIANFLSRLVFGLLIDRYKYIYLINQQLHVLFINQPICNLTFTLRFHYA